MYAMQCVCVCVCVCVSECVCVCVCVCVCGVVCVCVVCGGVVWWCGGVVCVWWCGVCGKFNAGTDVDFNPFAVEKIPSTTAGTCMYM